MVFDINALIGQNLTSKSKWCVLIIAWKWDVRFFMYVLGTVCYQHIHRSQIWRWVLSVMCVQSDLQWKSHDFCPSNSALFTIRQAEWTLVIVEQWSYHLQCCRCQLSLELSFPTPTLTKKKRCSRSFKFHLWTSNRWQKIAHRLAKIKCCSGARNGV